MPTVARVWRTPRSTTETAESGTRAGKGVASAKEAARAARRDW